MKIYKNQNKTINLVKELFILNSYFLMQNFENSTVCYILYVANVSENLDNAAFGFFQSSFFFKIKFSFFHKASILIALTTISFRHLFLS